MSLRFRRTRYGIPTSPRTIAVVNPFNKNLSSFNMSVGSVQAPSVNYKIWRPDDGTHPSPAKPGSSEIYRPDVLETIEAEIKRLDGDLRNLSLDIHGKHDLEHFRLRQRADNLLPCPLSAHPELSFEEL